MKKKFRFFTFFIPVILATPVVFLNAIRFNLPTGYSGLYSLMVEVLVNNNFRLPNQVPFYGPGGIPYVYPPLAFFFGGVIIKSLNISIWTYLRFGPPVLYLFCLFPLYLLTRQILKSRLKAAVTIALFPVIPVVYYYHDTSAGIVRSIALLTALAALGAFYYSLKKGSFRFASLAGLFVGLTVLTHLSYFIFILVSQGVFIGFLSSPKTLRKNLILAVTVVVVASLVSLPWWLHILSTYGLAPLLAATQTHGTVNFLTGMFHPMTLTGSVLGPLENFIKTSFIALPALIGAAYLILKRDFFLPTWFLLTLLFISEEERYLGIIASLIAAVVMVRLTSILAARFWPNPNRHWARIGMLIFFVIVYYEVEIPRIVIPTQPKLSADTFEMAAWFRIHSDKDVNYLFISDDHDEAEWLPWLLERKPTIGHWGSEWIGSYPQEIKLFDQLAGCATAQSYHCVETLLETNHLHPNYIIVAMSNKIDIPLPQKPVFQNGSYSVWKVEG
jgi:hypothetical protein